MNNNKNPNTRSGNKSNHQSKKASNNNLDSKTTGLKEEDKEEKYQKSDKADVLNNIKKNNHNNKYSKNNNSNDSNNNNNNQKLKPTLINERETNNSKTKAIQSNDKYRYRDGKQDKRFLSENNRWHRNEEERFADNRKLANSKDNKTQTPSFVDKELSKELFRFWSRLEDIIQNTSHKSNDNLLKFLDLNDENIRKLWFQCWSAASEGAKGPSLLTLPKSLLSFPDIARALPPPSHVAKVLLILLQQVAQKELVPGLPDILCRNKLYNVLEVTLNIIRDRLRGHVQIANNLHININEIMNNMNMIKDQFKSIFSKAIGIIEDDVEKFIVLMQRSRIEIEEYQKLLSSLPAASAISFPEESIIQNDWKTIEPWNGWRIKPTIGWLMSKSWHLDIPELKSSYTDSNEYSDTMLRIWTLLTFYWGSGAVWPKCCSSHSSGQGEASMCGNPLLNAVSAKHGGRCTVRYQNQQCKNNSMWKCLRSGHDMICEDCLRQQQTALIGQPSRYASTDIYDGVVERETTRREGVVYIVSRLESRKPPQVGPNWRTSYRLQTSGLVGIVKLGLSKEPLSRDSEIQWAEVVPIDLAYKEREHELRSKGKLAFRFLSRGDCPTFSVDVDSPIDVGTRIVIIDLRVFVPEVVSVLATFAQDSFKDHLSQIPFVDCLIGKSSGFSMDRIDMTASKHEVIRQAIFISEIEAVSRLTIDQKISLASKICNMKQVQSLYGTQFEAFIAGLTASVHCTQGPPGTGKSYVGVALVLAFIIIKEESLKYGYPLGPVLMLSYKNHALDEFLCDVVELSSPKLTPSCLIRSGKPENPKLLYFSEKHSAEEIESEKTLKYRVEVIRRTQRIVREWYDCALYLETQTWKSQLSNSSIRPFCDAAVAISQGLVVLVSFLKIRLLNPDSQHCDSQSAFDQVSKVYQHPIVFEQQLSIKELLSNFITSVEHWIDPRIDTKLSIEMWINHWILGHTPPSRCNYFTSEDNIQCMEVAEGSGSYCRKYHSCQVSHCDCNNVRVGTSNVPYCALHKCSYNGDKQKLSPCKDETFLGSKFCMSHVCSGCLSMGLVSSNVSSISNSSPVQGTQQACKKHTCSFKDGNDKMCTNLILFPFDFCFQHCCSICLFVHQPIESNILPQIMNSKYCKQHICAVNNCRSHKYSSGEYCISHVCLLCIFKISVKEAHLWSAIDSAIPNGGLCADHRCSMEDCGQARIDSSVYCILHTCRICRERNILPPLGIVINENIPRNVCAQHLLCNHMFVNGNICNEVADADSLYCAYHNNLLSAETKFDEIAVFIEEIVSVPVGSVCLGITKKKMKCKCRNIQHLAYYGDQIFCQDHKSQASFDKSATIAQENILKNNFIDEIEDASNKSFEKMEIECQESWKKQVNTMRSIKRDMVKQDAAYISMISERSKVRQCVWRDLISQKQCPVYVHDSNICSLHKLIIDLDNQPVICVESTPLSAINVLSAREINSVISSPSNFALSVDNENIVVDKIDESFIATGPVIESIDKSIIFDINSMPDLSDVKEIDIEGNIDPDERDMYDYDQGLEIEEENEELKRLRDINNNDDVSIDNDKSDCESLPDATFDGSKNNNSSIENEDTALGLVKEWSWNMTLESRRASASLFLKCVSNILNKLRISSDDHVVAARTERNQAGSKALKRAKVVGATVIGAARRLEAIRAAEPFAAVIEESCEVMEPTLMAVLAVKSLKKLELIGDQRQLPAFVQQCWFNLEVSHPTIKTSLFERLVEGGVKRRNQNIQRNGEKPNSHQLTSTVILDEQRRMRTAIADLTRPEYEDIVAVTDHPSTATQCIGDKVTDKLQIRNLHLHRSLWETNGRETPGILPSVFFWDLINNKEGRAAAGLSACNPVEAVAVAHLSKFLLLSGVPPSCISIITPYKGQKTAIIKELRNLKLLPSYRNDRPVDTNSLINVSTVDRYQGDENDIVIISLVRTRPGNRFVALNNRFIVALSRARLGCYVVGCVGAVDKDMHGKDGPLHWRRFISDLSLSKNSQAAITDIVCNKSPKEIIETDEDIENSSNDGQDDQEQIKPLILDNTYKFNRISSNLPICCPRHRSLTAVSLNNPQLFPTNETWSKFCNLPCNYFLPECNHQCQKACHSPVLISHTESCQVLLNSPCSIHSDMQLFCCNLRGKHSTLKEALGKFKCDVEVEYCRIECNHSTLISCDLHSSLTLGLKSLPKCEEIVADFIHPVCNHVFKAPRCYERRQYEAKSPVCQVRVNHRRPCGCVVNMKCDQRVAELSNENISKCMTDRNSKRPRCGHLLSLRCHEATELNNLWNDRCNINYDKCNLDYDNGDMLVVKSNLVYGCDETSISPKIPKCSNMVMFQDNCGHWNEVPCHLAFSYASKAIASPRCEELKEISNPLCGHNIRVPCWSSDTITDWNPWRLIGEPIRNDTGIVIPETALHCMNSEVLPRMYMDILKSGCSKRSCTLARLCNHLSETQVFIQHEIKISCSSILEIIQGRSTLGCCKIQVMRKLPCNHSVKVLCHQKLDNPPPICHAKVEDIYCFPCGDHSIKSNTCSHLQSLLSDENPKCPFQVESVRYRCNHTVIVSCWEREKATRISPGNCITDIDNYDGDIVSANTVYANEIYCEKEEDLPPCNEFVKYYQSCGHIKNEIKCHVAFDWSNKMVMSPECEVLEENISPFCSHPVSTYCSIWKKLDDWNPWTDNQPKYDTYTEAVGTDGNVRTVRIYNISNFALPSPLPPTVSFETLDCHQSVKVERNCGHIFEVNCIDAYKNLLQFENCMEKITFPCSDCGVERECPCSSFNSDILSGIHAQCKNKVKKDCTICRINYTIVPCHNSDPVCNKLVTIILPNCLHEVKWHCGKDPDPRKGDFLCRICSLNQWKVMLKNEEEEYKKIQNSDKIIIENKKNEFLLTCQNLILKQLTESGEMLRVHNFNISFANFQDARIKIIKKFLTYMTKDPRSKSINSPPSFMSSEDFDNYHIVYRIIKSNNKNKNDIIIPNNTLYKLNDRTNTEYGFGYEVNRLTNSLQISKCETDDNGILKIIFGVSFSLKKVENTPPFVTKHNNNNNNNNNNRGKNNNHNKAKDSEAKANKMSITFQDQGSDCICSNEKNSNSMVHWIPYSVIPICYLEMKTKISCCLCFETFSRSEGFFCSQRHFICWKRCFNAYIESSEKPDAVGTCLDQHGNLTCPECKEPYNLLEVAKNSSSPETFQKLLKLTYQSKKESDKQLNEAVKTTSNQLIKQYEALLSIKNEEDRAAAKLRLDIIDDILTLKCPRCKTAFIDFSGCAALTCSNINCKCGFCAYCLKDCGNDAHPHVPSCGNMFLNGGFQEFERIQVERRRKEIISRLNLQSSDIRRRVLILLKKDLEDLNIII